MPPQFPRPNKALATPATPVLVVVCVEDDDVLLHGRLPREPVRTEGAAVWPLSRVDPLVSGEVRPRHEPGRAHLAPVGLHAIVGFYMCRVLRRDVKRSATLFTAADLLPGVDAFVVRQVTTRFERLPADVTHVRPVSGMCKAVSRQSTPHSKRLATLVTAERPLSCMRSLVTCHVSRVVC